MKRLILSIAAVACCTAQAPAPTPQPIIAVPLKNVRHLEYSLGVSYTQTGEEHDSGFNGSGGEGGGGNGSGVEANFGSGGRVGVIDADVVAFTNDGALVIKIHEMLQSAPRPGEEFTCLVYPDGHTTCPSSVTTPSDAEDALLALLGRGFLDPANDAAGAHWSHAFSGKDVSVRTDFIVKSAPPGGPVTIHKDLDLVSHTPNVGNTTGREEIVYDPKMLVPVSLHDVSHESFSDATVDTTIDLKLTKDSYAAPSPTPTPAR
ncbi:MAG TPA: hypothetical protein VMH02_05475 [Verrucomicrobiae bacterium]|nr:hypothetical protein [Verrucomicrobiae bacterium]